MTPRPVPDPLAGDPHDTDHDMLRALIGAHPLPATPKQVTR